MTAGALGLAFAVPGKSVPVDPDGEFPSEERRRRAAHTLRAHMLSLRSALWRRRRRAESSNNPLVPGAVNRQTSTAKPGYLYDEGTS